MNIRHGKRGRTPYNTGQHRITRENHTLTRPPPSPFHSTLPPPLPHPFTFVRIRGNFLERANGDSDDPRATVPRIRYENYAENSATASIERKIGIRKGWGGEEVVEVVVTVVEDEGDEEKRRERSSWERRREKNLILNDGTKANILVSKKNIYILKTECNSSEKQVWLSTRT